MNITKAMMVVSVIVTTWSVLGERTFVPRMAAVVTNDFSLADLDPYFGSIDVSSTNIVLRFRDKVPKLHYVVDDKFEDLVSEPGVRVALGTDHTFGIADGRHAKLIIRGFAEKDVKGFELTSVFDARSFGRGVAVRYGRLLLPNEDTRSGTGELKIIGAKALRTREPSDMPDADVRAIKQMFADLVAAYGSHDIDRLKCLTGDSIERWLRWMDGEEKLGGVEVVRCLAGEPVRVSAEITLLGAGDDPYPFPVSFSLRRVDGCRYCIVDMTLAAADRWNRLLDSTIETTEKLINAINSGDLAAVGELLYQASSQDLETELSGRGLLWIKEAVEQGVEIPARRMAVRCVDGRWMEGSVSVPNVSSSSNILRRVVFVGSKIQRDARVANPRVDGDFNDWLKARLGRGRDGGGEGYD